MLQCSIPELVRANNDKKNKIDEKVYYNMVLIHNEPFRPKAHDPVYHLMSLRAKRFIVYQNHVMIYFIIDLYISDAIFMLNLMMSMREESRFDIIEI